MSELLFSSDTATITDPPVNQTVLLGTDAEFQCIHSMEDFPWEINGTTLNAENATQLEDRGIRATLQFSQGEVLVKSKLQVEARYINNNTEIRCVAGGQESEPAFLTIQGRLL